MISRGVRSWLRGLLSALFSGVAGGAGVAVVDPSDFNFQEPGKLIAVTAWTAGIGVVNFLKQSPFPDDEPDDPAKYLYRGFHE